MKIFQRLTPSQFGGNLPLSPWPGSSPAAFLPLLTLAALVGCASPKQALVLDPIGPEPRSASGGAAQGSLLVFTAFDTTPDWNRSPYRRRFTDYQILSADGNHLVQVVSNNRETLLNNPPAVGLPAGSYRVVARANGYGTIAAPVVIKPGQITTVHLEGSVWWPRSSPIWESNPVRLPKGEIVGWRADAR